MNRFSRNGRIGLLTVFAALLMPLLGIGNALAIDVGDQVNVLVPDLREFASEPVEHQFTCRAITEHAVWLVQDTSMVDNKGGFDVPDFEPKIVWGDEVPDNLVAPADFAALTASFESNVWGTVTAACGVPADLNSDGKVVVILAALPTEFNDPSSQNQLARFDMYYADPEFNEIEGEATEVFYVNIHGFTTAPSTYPAAVQLREWNLADGLSNLCLNSTQDDEEEWLKRGLAGVMQYECFGLTESTPGKHGIYNMLKDFQLQPSLQLDNPFGCKQNYNFQPSRGQSFMWFMYLSQREGSSLISTIAQDSEYSGMLSIAYALDPSATEETAVEDNVVPLYYDWLVCNLHNDFRSDYAGGIYMYDFLGEETQFSNKIWAHANMNTSFSLKFSQYPIVGEEIQITVLEFALAAPIWASQYVRFTDYSQNWETLLNAQYSDGRGSGAAVNSRWEGFLVKVNLTNEEIVSIEPLTFDDLYNSTFNLSEEVSYVILTNNNPGGTSLMRYFVSNDYVAPETEFAIHQNSVSSEYITAYTALVDPDTREVEGYDWIGPIFEATHVQSDSTLNIKMVEFYGEIMTGVFTAWSAGNYELEFAGYDSSGHSSMGLREVAVGYVDTDLILEVENARLEVPKGGAASGSMVTLAETGTLGLAIESSSSIENVRGHMTGVIAGPVSIPTVNGTLSFSSATDAASVYRYTSNGWVMLDSWLQGGRISAAVEEGGIYALGEGIGVFAPEIPAQLVLAANAPNPFAAQTAISFGLPVSGNVRLNVFDMTGRLVTTIANEDMAAANHTIIWDGTDATGSPVGAGVYFCRLETAGQVLTQKMLKVQ